MKHSSLALNI